MQSSEAVNEIRAIDADDASFLKKRLNDFERFSVVLIAEHRNEHDGISDIKICIARGKPAFAVADISRHWQFDDIKRQAVRIG